MKAKLFSFVGLVLAAIGASILFTATPVHAQGEQYEWVGPNTIRASGGSYENLSEVSGGTVDIPRKGGSGGLVFELFSSGGCDITVTITPSANNLHGTLATQGCEGNSGNTFDRQFDIANPRQGPPLPGSDVDFANLNCDSDVVLVDRCYAMQECMEAGQSKTDCLWAWTICMDQNNATQCRLQVGSGNVDTGGDEAGGTGDETTCAIDGIGWILCPTLNFLAGLADGSYNIVSALLEVQPLLTTGTTAPTYQAWSVMRNIANVAFVIAFMIIIFSQITSFGISNYGIKKMLPRLIIAAILVNISYWVCALAVDLSNILGSSLKEVFNSIGASLPIPDFGATQTGGGGWQDIVTVGLTAAIGIGIALYVGLSALIPMLITVVFAIVVVFLVLALRQALIILLIVISPLAFVAYLLPNTESWFSKWRSLFQTLLLMYPIIALIFGASALASQVVTSSANSIEDPVQKFVVQVMGAGIAVIPLIITPIVMRTAGNVLGRFGAFINNPNKGPFDRAKRAAEGLRERQEGRRAIRSLSGRKNLGFGKYKRTAKREAVKAGVATERGRAQSAYVAEQALQDEGFRNRLAGGTARAEASPEALNRAMASAVSAQAKIEADEVTAASAIIKNLNLDSDEMRTLAMGNETKGVSGANQAIRAAAIKNVVDTHDVKGVNNLLNDMPNMNEKTRESFADALQNSKERPHYVSQGAIADIRQGKTAVNPTTGVRDTDASGNAITISQQLTANAINNNTYSPEKLATGDKDELAEIARVAANPAIATNNADIASNAAMAKSDPRLSGMIGKNADAIDNISRL